MLAYSSREIKSIVVGESWQQSRKAWRSKLCARQKLAEHTSITHSKQKERTGSGTKLHNLEAQKW